MKKGYRILLCLALLCGCADQPVSEEPTEEPEAVETAPPQYACRTFDYYDYKKPAPSSDAAAEEEISDMMVAGDSRVGSLYLYTDLRDQGAEIWYTTSVSLWRIYDVPPDYGSSKALFDLILDTEKHNIYILIGINEIRYSEFTTWGEEFNDAVDEIIAAHPDDSIYLILNYQPRGLSNISDSDLWNHVKEENDNLIRIAREKHIYYIDISDELADESGLIRSDLVWDGLHFNKTGAVMFADYLTSHIVRKENYVKEICE